MSVLRLSPDLRRHILIEMRIFQNISFVMYLSIHNVLILDNIPIEGESFVDNKSVWKH